MAFELPDLPYAADALEPHFDAETIRIHHGAHHRTYVEKLNAALDGSELADRPIEELLSHLDQVPEPARSAVRNNGGGHYNHSLWWPSLSPDGGGQPAGELGTDIDRTFGSIAALRGELTDAAVARFGSGWAWLALDGERLRVLSTANQDNPLTDGLVPLLGADVWEHAYYLRYQNKRPAYLDAWWNLVDWGVVADRYAEGAAVSASAPKVEA